MQHDSREGLVNHRGISDQIRKSVLFDLHFADLAPYNLTFQRWFVIFHFIHTPLYYTAISLCHPKEIEGAQNEPF